MKSVCVTYDVEGWAWHARAMALQKYAPSDVHVELRQQYHIDSIDSREHGDKPHQWDVVFHQGWNDSWPALGADATWAMVASLGIMFPRHNPDEHKPDLWARCSSRSKNDIKAYEYLPLFEGIICINPKAVDFCKSINKNTIYLSTGIDAEFFHPPETRERGHKLKIGWCGKPSEPRRFSAKGYHEILLPLMHALEDQPIEWCINTRTAANALSREEMRDWYQDLDVFLCTASHEGTPSTVLEAMACGCAIISTDVGIVKEAVSGGAGNVVPGYRYESEIAETRDRLRDAILWLLQEANLKALQRSARENIEKRWHWKQKAPVWLHRLVAE